MPGKTMIASICVTSMHVNTAFQTFLSKFFVSRTGLLEEMEFGGDCT